MAEAARTLFLEDEGAPEREYPLVLTMPELPEDELIRRRAGRFVRAVGAAALHDRSVDVERFAPESDFPTLKDAIHAAARGNEQARRFITMSARTDVVERTIKAGHVMRVELASDEDGYILQHGQRMTDVYANSLQLVAPGPMHRRAYAETINGFRMMNVRRQGLLKEYAFVVFSRYPDDMSDKDAGAAGFFADTKSCSIQTLHEWDGKLVQESAFVAGVTERGGRRHDQAAVDGVVAELGMLPANDGATGILATPLLVHRSLMPNGVVDLVRRYDYHAGGTFFGTAQPSEDYVAYLAKCREREALLEPRAQGIVADLIAEASTINAPLAAVQRLHELSQRTMVDHAITDASIDPRVFGPEAAAHIERARYWLEQGDYSRFMRFRDSAQDTAYSSSCPAGFKSGEQSAGEEGGAEDGVGAEASSFAASSGEMKKMTCPFCGDKNQYGDPCSPNQYCRNCSARVINGKVVSKGNGGRQADAQARPEAVRILRREEGGRKAAQLALAA